ncbi:MAG TPA: carboxypeptidase regulatory-like domain-containing protein [Gemmatimonadaceae bacterium]|nr:carboxypeptidase regulatory-like domain-containing protein [Gemmatimonadaceae bacterium]
MKPMPRFRAGVLYALVALMPTAASSQQDHSGVFRGAVRRDSSKGSPIEGAEIILESVGTTRTTPQGIFAFRDLVPGSYAVTVRHPNYRPQTGRVAIAHADTIDLTISMEPVESPLPAVTVVGAPRPVSIGMAEFETRRAGGVGKYLTAKDFDGRGNATLTDVLRTNIPGLLFVQQPGGGFAAAGKRAIQKSLAPSNRRTDFFGGALPEDQCYMQLFVDGQRIYTYHRPGENGPNPPKLEDFPVSNILGVEIYRGAAETPTQFNTPGAACGTIVIWTGRRE